VQGGLGAYLSHAIASHCEDFRVRHPAKLTLRHFMVLGQAFEEFPPAKHRMSGVLALLGLHAA